MAVCPFVLFLLAFALSVRLPFTDSRYPFGIFKLSFLYIKVYADMPLEWVNFLSFRLNDCVVNFQLYGWIFLSYDKPFASTWVQDRFLVGCVFLIFLAYCDGSGCVLSRSLYCALCARCCQYLWIVHSELTLRFSLTFIYQ